LNRAFTARDWGWLTEGNGEESEVAAQNPEREIAASWYETTGKTRNCDQLETPDTE